MSEISEAYESQTCPKCKSKKCQWSEDYLPDGTPCWIVECQACGLKRLYDDWEYDYGPF